MIIGEYVVKCPNCLTEVRLVAEMVSPIMVYCPGCGRTVVLSHNAVYTLSHEFVMKLSQQQGVRLCGNVLSTQVSSTAKQLISDDKIKELHELLGQKLDVKDFIKKINR
jgi:hypothetical protein